MGTITIVSAIFVGKNAVENLRISIANEVEKAKVRFQTDHEKDKALEARVLYVENSIDSIEKKIDEKIDKLYDLVRTLTSNINEMEKRILEKIHDRKNG